MRKIQLIILLATVVVTNFAFAGWGPGYPGMSAELARIYPTTFHIDGKDAKELFEFLPINPESHIQFQELESPVRIFRSFEFECIKYGQVGDAHGGQREACTEYSNRKLKEFRQLLPVSFGLGSNASFFGCEHDRVSKKYSCVFKEAKPIFNRPFAFANGSEVENNALGKSLRGRSFASSSGLFNLNCKTIAENRYYDCFISINR